MGRAVKEPSRSAIATQYGRSSSVKDLRELDEGKTEDKAPTISYLGGQTETP